MGIKVPQLSRFCFCIPLRTGLLTFGYINLVFHGLIFIIAACLAFITFLMYIFPSEYIPIEVSLLIHPLVKVGEVTFYVFVLAATHNHMNNARKVGVILILGTALLLFTVPYSVCIVYRLRRLASTDTLGPIELTTLFSLYLHIITAVFDPILLGYTLLLVWSLKLRRKNNEEYIDLI